MAMHDKRRMTLPQISKASLATLQENLGNACSQTCLIDRQDLSIGLLDLPQLPQEVPTETQFESSDQHTNPFMLSVR